MDEPAVRPASERAVAADAGVFRIGGIDVSAFDVVVERLRATYPDIPVARIETILVREWEAFTAGRPLVVPVAVEEGVREVLDAASGLGG